MAFCLVAVASSVFLLPGEISIPLFVLCVIPIALALGFSFSPKLERFPYLIPFCCAIIPAHAFFLATILSHEDIGYASFAYTLITAAGITVFESRRLNFAFAGLSVFLLASAYYVGHVPFDAALQHLVAHAIFTAFLSIIICVFPAVTRSPMEEDIDYLNILHQLNEGVMFVDNDGICLEMNERWHTLTGYSREELIGKDATKILLHPEDRGQMESNLQKRKHGEQSSYEIRIRTKYGHDIWTMTVGAPMYNTDGKIIGSLGIMTDITPLYEMNRKLEEYTKNLERSNQKLTSVNKELEDFASIVSHDLRAPLSTIIGFTQLLEKSLAERALSNEKEFIGFINQGCKNMSETIEGVLHLARFGSRHSDMTPIPLAEIMEHVLLGLRVKMEKTNAQISFEDLPVIRADRTQMHQLFQNLIENAIKYGHPDRPPKIDISFTQDHTGVSIHFKDNGIGIEPEYQDQIFHVFAQLDPKSEGIGLGLATCKKIIDNHEGKIWVQSEPGLGTTFSVFLPSSPDEQGEGAPAEGVVKSI